MIQSIASLIKYMGLANVRFHKSVIILISVPLLFCAPLTKFWLWYILNKFVFSKDLGLGYSQCPAAIRTLICGSCLVPAVTQHIHFCVYMFFFLWLSPFNASPLLIRSVLSGNCLLFPGRHGFAPPIFPTTRWGGGLTGLVPLPLPNLLPSTDDGCCFVPVGSQESPQKLHPNDCI